MMVIIVHVTEQYYCTDTGAYIASESDRYWVAFVNSICRPAVPLFVMASAYLLLPLAGTTTDFFKRRFVRVFVPFVFWLLMYAVLPPFLLESSGWDGVVSNLGRILYNFTDLSGHLWYIYMLIGVYCLMPVISPWLRDVSKRGEEAFLVIWAITTFFHYGKAQLGMMWGEGIWNEFHALYYFSGFIGYVVLAHYIRTHVHWSLARSLAIGLPCIAVGYAVTAIYFYHASIATTDYYFVELSWRFCTFNIALMSFGMFVIMKHITCTDGWIYSPVKKLSTLSYGMYLMHIFWLVILFQWLSPILSSTPLTIVTVAPATFAASAATTWLISQLPGGKYLVG